MTFDLINCLEFLNLFNLYFAKPCIKNDLLKFHSEEYISFMNNYGSQPEQKKKKNIFRVGCCEDTPAFDGFFEFAKIVAGSSL